MKKLALTFALAFAFACTAFAQVAADSQASSSASGNASATAGQNSAALASGTTMGATLNKSVDARHAKVGDQVTAKTTEAVARCLREGRIAARLHHPNAITVFDVVDEDNVPNLVMEYLQGITLHPDNALQFDFLIHKGQGNLDGDQKNIEYKKILLIKRYISADLSK